jgi:hypothetical protein
LSPSQQDPGSLWDQDGPGYLVYGGFSHVFGELMLNVKAVYTDGGFRLDPRGSDVNPVTGHEEGNDWLNVDAGSRFEGSTVDLNTNRNSIDVSLDGNYFLEGALGSDHEIRFGVDYFTADTDSQSLYPNQRIAYVYRDLPGSNYITFIPDFIFDLNFKRISAYIQDTVTFGKLTATLGLRYDKESGGLNDFTQPYLTWYEPGTEYHGMRMFADAIPALDIKAYDVPASWKLLSPRMSLTYDITGDGKNVLKLSAGRYMSQSGNSIAINYVPFRYCCADWGDANGDEIPQYNEVGALFLDTALYTVDFATGMNRVQYADDYNSPMLDELTLTFEKALTEDLAFSLTGFYKKRSQLSQDYNSRGEIVNVSNGIMADGSIETKANWQYRGTVRVGGTDVPAYDRLVDPIGNYYYNKAKAYDLYLGLQFSAVKKLSKRWMANFSFTYQDWKRHRFADEELNLNNLDFFNGGQAAPATVGSGLRDIWVNSRWMVKFTGMYQLPFGVNFTTFFQAREGNPQPLRRLVLLNQGWTYMYRSGHKVGDERLPALWMLNLGLEKTLKVADSVTATLVLDWYNATNNQIELMHNLAIGDDAPASVQPTMWTNAGLFQFGVRVNF